jgi:hypothetical protein
MVADKTPRVVVSAIPESMKRFRRAVGRILACHRVSEFSAASRTSESSGKAARKRRSSW